MTTEQIDIRIREDGSRVVKRRLDDVGGSADRAGDAVDRLKSALAGLGGVLAIAAVLRLADSYTNLQNRLRSVGLEGTQLTGVYNELLRVSNATRSSVEGSVELYARLALSSKELGVSQKQLIDFTTSLNQAITLSGASGTEAQAGLIQLSQGLASGVLRGDELRSVLEQLPAVADVIAKGLGVTRGQLRALGEDGKITAKAVLDAFKEARVELSERFAKTVPTLSQSFTVLRNAALDFVGRLDAATGATTFLSRAMLALGQNFDTVVKAVAAVAAGFVLLGGGVLVVNALRAAFIALAVAIAANPLGAFLVVLTSVITGLVLFGDKIDIGLDRVTKLSDLLRAFGEVAGAGFDVLRAAAANALGVVGGEFKALFQSVDVSLVGFIRGVAGVVDMFVGLWRGAVGAVLQLFISVPPAVADLFTQALNIVLTQIGKFVNKAGELLNSVTEFVGLGSLAQRVDFTLDNTSAGAARALGKDIISAFDDGVKSAGGATAFVDSVINRAQQFGQARDEVARLAARNPNNVSDAAGAPAKLPVDAKGVQQAENALRSLLNTILPSAGAVLELAKAEKVLNEAVGKGLITRARANELSLLAKEYYKDQIDPLGAITRGLAEEQRLLSFTAREREVENKLSQIGNDLKRQGLPLTEAQTAALRNQLTVLQQTNALVQAQDALLGQSVNQRQAFATQLQAIQALLANPGTGFTQGDAAQAVNAMSPELFAGTQTAIDAQLESFRTMYAQIDALRQADLISEQTATAARARVSIQQNEARLSNTRDFFGNLASLSSSGNKRLAAIGRAAALSQATIDGVLAVQKALAAPPGWPYNAANVVAVGVSAAANVARIAGFEQGGFTGNGGRSDIAGVVHGQEFVVTADATARNRSALEAMNAGRDVAMGGSQVNIEIVNLPGQTVEREERQTPNGRDIKLTVKRIVTEDVRQGGEISEAFANQFGLNRAAGALR